MTDIHDAISVLLSRGGGYVLAEQYYEGEREELMTPVLRSILKGKVGNDYNVNFCRTIVESVLDRTELANVTVNVQEAQEKVNNIWEQNDLALEANEIHRKALVYGDAYALVWPDENDEMIISYSSPRNTVIIYDEENRRRKLFAARTWRSRNNGADIVRVDLFYPDRVEKFSANSKFLTEKQAFILLETVDNPFGEVPLFHFRTNRPYGRPEHKDAFGIQDAITKTVATHMYTMDYQGAPQRYALSGDPEAMEVNDFADNDTERENVNGLQNGPGQLWFLRGVHTVGQFQAADPDAFLKPLQNFVRAMASLTNTPLHYFETSGNVPSGEALRTAEAPLLKKVSDRQRAFGSAWRDLFRFILKAEGNDVDVTVGWLPVESMDSLARWDVQLKKINAGLSHQQALREAGYDEELIDKIMGERDSEAKAGQYYQRRPEVRVGESKELGHFPTGKVK